MIQDIDFSDENILRLKEFLSLNSGTNFKLFNLHDQVALANLDWSGFDEIKDQVLPLLFGYQRILRIMPKEREHYAFIFLKQGIHSALQIAGMTMKQYMTIAMELIPEDQKSAEEIYNGAIDKRSTVLVQYMDILQNSEPHISAARFN